MLHSLVVLYSPQCHGVLRGNQVCTKLWKWCFAVQLSGDRAAKADKCWMVAGNRDRLNCLQTLWFCFMAEAYICMLDGEGHTAFCQGAYFCLECSMDLWDRVMWVSALGAGVLNLVMLLHDNASVMPPISEKTK